MRGAAPRGGGDDHLPPLRRPVPREVGCGRWRGGGRQLPRWRQDGGDGVGGGVQEGDGVRRGAPPRGGGRVAVRVVLVVLGCRRPSALRDYVDRKLPSPSSSLPSSAVLVVAASPSVSGTIAAGRRKRGGEDARPPAASDAGPRDDRGGGGTGRQQRLHRQEGGGTKMMPM